MKHFEIAGRQIGPEFPPLVIAEIGINHEGDFGKAVRMVDDAAAAGCECAKFQSHVIEDEMIPNNVIPGNAKESIWDIMKRCALSEEEEIELKRYVESEGHDLPSCTPFSRARGGATWNRLAYRLIKSAPADTATTTRSSRTSHLTGKPVILGTGMNNLGAASRLRWTSCATPGRRLRCFTALPCIPRPITRCGLARLGRWRAGSRMPWSASAITRSKTTPVCAAVALGRKSHCGEAFYVG